MAGTTVADVLIDGLTRAGARRVFTVAAAPAALPDAGRRRGLPVVEAPDAAAATVLAAVTGEIGDGPGAAVAALDDAPGLVRGLAHAQRDRAPLILITEAGPDAALLAPVVKASLAVEAASAAHWVAHAAHLAMTDPRGPVHLGVGPATLAAPALALATAVRPAPLPPPTEAMLDALGGALEGATRPLLITGLECGADDAKWLRALAETLPAPVLATPKGRGTLADPHPLALGPAAPGHAALARADLVVLVGVDAGELPPGLLPAGARLARIGRSPWSGAGLLAEALGDLALVIEELAPRVRARRAADWDVAELDRIKRALARETAATPAARMIALAREATPAGTLATSDGPPLAAWQAVAPHQTLVALGPPPPAYAGLAGVAAQLAHPDRRVVAFTSAAAWVAGERALGLATALRLPLIVVVVDALAEGDFAAAFARAFQARGPAVVAGAGR